MLASSFSLLSFLNAHSSLPSFTKALMTAMPEKLSWAKSLKLENASWRRSHLSDMLLPTMMLAPMRHSMGIKAKPVSRGFIRHIFTIARQPRNAASQHSIMPQE